MRPSWRSTPTARSWASVREHRRQRRRLRQQPGAVIVVAIGPKVITGVYHVPALHLRGTAVLTHTNLVSAYRGAGRPEAIYLVERLMDQAAAEMKIDPAELRRRNFIQPAQMPYTTPMGETFDSGNFPAHARIASSSTPTGKASTSAGGESRRAASCAAARCRRSWSGPASCTRRRSTCTSRPTARVLCLYRHAGDGPGHRDQLRADHLRDAAHRSRAHRDRAGRQRHRAGPRQHGQPLALHRRLGDADRVEAGDREGRELAAEALEAPAADLVYSDGRFKVAGTDLGIDLFDWRGEQPESASRSRRCRRSAARRGRTAAMSAKSRSIPRPAQSKSCGTPP